jgi:hypothetical protein
MLSLNLLKICLPASCFCFRCEKRDGAGWLVIQSKQAREETEARDQMKMAAGLTTKALGTCPRGGQCQMDGLTNLKGWLACQVY